MKAPAQSPQSVLRVLAIKLLAQREHSRAELAKKLAAKLNRLQRADAAASDAHNRADTDNACPVRLPSIEDIDKVLDQLEQKGLLSDERAAQAYARSHANRFGTARLTYNLRQRGIADELISSSLAQEEIADEYSRAHAVWRSRFAQAPRDAREWARQARFLQGRGFAVDLIRKLLKNIEKSDDPSADIAAGQDMEGQE